jgi:hypothetical protein
MIKAVHKHELFDHGYLFVESKIDHVLLNKKIQLTLYLLVVFY